MTEGESISDSPPVYTNTRSTSKSSFRRGCVEAARSADSVRVRPHRCWMMDRLAPRLVEARRAGPGLLCAGSCQALRPPDFAGYRAAGSKPPVTPAYALNGNSGSCPTPIRARVRGHSSPHRQAREPSLWPARRPRPRLALGLRGRTLAPGRSGRSHGTQQRYWSLDLRRNCPAHRNTM